jgi:hypothetical protein
VPAQDPALDWSLNQLLSLERRVGDDAAGTSRVLNPRDERQRKAGHHQQQGQDPRE